ncbi:oxidoreductase FAD/NAD(P)-binding subunit [Calothrix parasitica NIES-267]|uniref:Oxidoreductase FAD/NAD(P)-binding subunit n=1 Tax=Calothrix parasitica NIES-267 TaxID=1973488 RepID=A0A1Z4LMF6_9CYAN|nr:oxidoreductase FAD/NAD(P)-binding subunit [Calothrix parasitica NIES-267]
MVESFKKIENPWLKTTVYASMGFAISTIVTGAVIGFINPKNKDLHKLAVCSSLVGITAGSVLSYVLKDKETSKKSESESNSTIAKVTDESWKDWRDFVVFKKVQESSEITSFYLKLQDEAKIPSFKPGQFLTIQLNIPGIDKPVIRTYSLSDYSPTNQYYRLSIKREPAPKDLDVPPGVASNFMHDSIQEGDIIPAKPPNGRFYLDVEKPTPVVLISNGVGITPMYCMAKACIFENPQRQVYFVHGARNGNFHAFQQEVMGLSKQNPNLKVHYRYSRPQEVDGGNCHSTGYVDIDLIKELAYENAEFYLCGSPAFMDSLRAGLKEWGVADNKVFFESFSKAPKKADSESSTTVDGVETAEIKFVQSGKTLTWNKGDGTILEFAEANGINPAFSCRVGVCLTCSCKIQEGEVAYLEEPSGTPDDGEVLICISQPKTEKVVLDI